MYMCVCVCVCHCGAAPPSTTKTRCCGDLGQCPVLAIGFWGQPPPSTKIPALWGFWIVSSPGSLFLDLLNTVCIQAIPTLWGFWILSRPVSRVLVILYTTTPQPHTPTSYLPACRFRRWVGLLTRTLRGFPNQSQIKSVAIQPPQVGNDGKAGPPGYVGKPATQPLYPWFCKYVLL